MATNVDNAILEQFCAITGYFDVHFSDLVVRLFILLNIITQKKAYNEV